MAVDQFIRIAGVDGESKDGDHEGEIDVLSWSWGATQSGSFHQGGGGGAGKVNVKDLSFTKWVDKASPVLTKMCCDGSHIDEAVLTVRKAGKKPLEYVIITMTKVMVTAVTHGGSGGEEKLTENVTLNFAEILYQYQPQKADGSADGGTVDMGWNIEANQPK